MSDKRTDRVELQGGDTHLPAEFREVARLANQAGLEGWKYVDLEYGLDLELARERLKQATGTPDLNVGSCVKITYEPQRPRTADHQGAVYVECQDVQYLEREIVELTAGLEALVKLQAHYATLLNMYDGGERIAFQNAEEWLTRLRVVATGEKAETKP